MMKILVSKEDKDLLELTWTRDAGDKIGKNFYAKRTMFVDGKKRKISMHRLIMERVLGRPLNRKEIIDHIDFNGLNNKRSNLRVCTHAQNSTNRGLNRNNRSGYRGVHYRKNKDYWKASICYRGKHLHIGVYTTERDAAIAYDAVAKMIYKEFYKPLNTQE